MIRNWSLKPFGRIWTPEMDADLRSMIENGRSFTEIAVAINAQYGTEFSRNAAIGRAHRLKVEQPPRSKKVREPKPKPKRVSTRKVRIAKPVVRDEQFIARLAAVEPLHLSLSEIQPGQCRYPFGEGPFTFCGNPQCANSSYCDPHRILCTGEGTSSERAVAPVHKPRQSEAIKPEIQEAA